MVIDKFCVIHLFLSLNFKEISNGSSIDTKSSIFSNFSEENFKTLYFQIEMSDAKELKPRNNDKKEKENPKKEEVTEEIGNSRNTQLLSYAPNDVLCF